MNSYTLGISGSLIALILSILVSFALAYYSYRNPIPPISSVRKWFMIALRTVAMSLLLFVLFEPILTRITGKTIEPKIAIYLDNSISASIDDGKGSRKATYKRILNELNLENNDNLLIRTFSGNINEIDEFKSDSLLFDGVETNISNVINYTSEITEKENIQANLIISDGSFNSGGNPIYEIERYDKPIFTIGIGDTNIPKDISIRSIISNEIGYIDIPLPVNVNINANAISDSARIVSLFENDRLIDSDTISIDPKRNLYTLLFEYTPNSEGMKKITAEVNGSDDEITLNNNQKSNFIRILKSKQKIAIFSGSPNPDHSFIKNELLKDDNKEVLEFIHKSGSSFYNSPTNELLNESEVMFLIDFPRKVTPNNVMEMIKKQLETGKPIMFISGKNTDFAKLRTIEDYLPFNTISSNSQEFLASPDVDSYSMSSPLLRVNGNDSDMDIWNSLPPIFKTETFVQVKPESELVAGTKVNDVDIQQPLIITRSFQKSKSVAVLGYGIYRWRLMGFAAEQAKNNNNAVDAFSYLVNNSLKWLSVDNRKKLFTIRSSKEQYTGNEQVELLAEVYDASYNPIENASVTATIKSEKEQRDINLLHKGNGRYHAIVEGLPSGDYSVNGRAVVNDRNIGTDIDRFSIGNLALEYTSLTMNKKLLQTISDRTDGEFFYQSGDNVIDKIKSLSNFQEKNINVTNETALWNLPWILAASIVLFGLEWFLRKRSGMI